MTARTAKEARAWLDYQGITVAQWSREHGFNEGLVHEVLAGRKRCLRGSSHNIAVALGMKDGIPTDRPARVPPPNTILETTMTKPTFEEFKKKSELIAELSNVVRHQVYGEMDWVRARTYWKTRLPELLENADELAEALTYALDKAALKPHPFDRKHPA